MDTFDPQVLKIRELTRLRVQRHRAARRNSEQCKNRVANILVTETSSSEAAVSDPEAPSSLVEDASENIISEVEDINITYRSENNYEFNEEAELDSENEEVSASEEEVIINNENEQIDEVEKIRRWALLTPAIPHNRLDGLLQILRRRLLTDLPKTSKTFLQTEMANQKIERFGTNNEFVYFGIEKYLRQIINVNVHNENVIDLIFNIDGIPLYRSSSKQFWPILGKVFNHRNIYKPFPIAIYCGNEKPDNVENYLQYFIDEINQLQQTGIYINDKLFTIKIKAFICDRPARAFIKCIKNHGAYWGCERCTVKGRRVNGRTIYPLGEGEERNDYAFRQQSNSEHHRGITPLININPPIDMVHDFVLDSMHLLYLGVMKKLLDYWLIGKSTCRLSQNIKNQLSYFMMKLQSQIPKEFQRTTRSMTQIENFKATELQFLLLYAGPVIFKKVLTEDVYNHFMLLHVACRLLNSKDQAVLYVENTKSFLRDFVRLAPLIYGETCLIGTFHNVIHLPDDVAHMGCPLSQISAFPFENALGKIKKMIRSGNKPLAQICRRLHETFFINTEKATVPATIQVLRKLKEDAFGNILIKTVKYNESILTTNSPNNTVLLRNNKILQINKIYAPTNIDDQSIKIHGTILNKKHQIFTYPCNSNTLKMWAVTKKRNNLFTCKLNYVRAKMVVLDISTEIKEKIYVMPLLHM